MLVERGHETKVLSQWKDNRRNYLLQSTTFAPLYRDDYETNGVIVSIRNPSFGGRLVFLPLLPIALTLPELCKPVGNRVFGEMLREFGPGIELVHNVRIGREYLSWASFRLAKQLGVPFFLTPNYSPRMMSPLGRILSRSFVRLMKLADKLFVFTLAEHKQLEELGVLSSKICQIAVGPLTAPSHDAVGFRKRFGINGPMVLFLGQKLPYKGYDKILQASQLVWEVHPKTHFVFIGPHFASSRRVFARYSDPRIVDISGVLPFDEVKASALSACDCFVLPSSQEGFGGVYVEAWSYGKPVIGCQIPFVREVIDDGVDGLLVPKDHRSIAKAILFLLSNPEIGMRMGKRGQEKVEARFSWTRIVDDVESQMLGSI